MHQESLNTKGIDNAFQIFKISHPMVQIKLPTLVRFVFYHALRHDKGILVVVFSKVIVCNMYNNIVAYFI